MSGATCSAAVGVPLPSSSATVSSNSIADSLSIVIGPSSLPSPMDTSADRDGWADRPIGYQLLPIERLSSWTTFLKVDSEPDYGEGGLTQLHASDFERGVEPDLGYLRHWSYLSSETTRTSPWTRRPR